MPTQEKESYSGESRSLNINDHLFLNRGSTYINLRAIQIRRFLTFNFDWYFCLSAILATTRYRILLSATLTVF